MTGDSRGQVGIHLLTDEDAAAETNVIWCKVLPLGFSLTVVNQADAAKSVTRAFKGAAAFGGQKNPRLRGWDKFMALADVKSKGFLVNDTLKVTVTFGGGSRGGASGSGSGSGQ